MLGNQRVERVFSSYWNIRFNKHFFPHKLNCAQNYNYVGTVPSKTDFFMFADSTSTLIEKEEFVNNCIALNYKWNFRKELLRHVDEKVLLLTLASLKFLRDCFNLQFLLQSSEKKNYLHPFGNNICTIAGFTYKVFKLFYLNSFPIFSICNEFGNNGKEISSQEAEWAAFMEFKHPDQKYRSSLSHPQGQKYFTERSISC